MEQIIPVINTEILQQKANEYAQKGAEETLREFYNGYNSPYKKAIEENLKNKSIDHAFDIPDIIAVLNEKISTEIDTIANTAISKTFIPFVKEFLIREDSEIKFSDILEKFIKCVGYDAHEDDYEDFQVENVERESYSDSLKNSFPVFRITGKNTGYELHLYVNKESTTITSLPHKKNDKGNYWGSDNYSQKMTLSLEGGASLELPFTKGILHDDFTKYCARLVIGNTNIIMDCTDFNEDMFPEREHCHC